MQQIIVQRTIQAPATMVFSTVSDMRRMAEALPHVVDVEFLSEQRTGVGTRYRETRRSKEKDSVTELSVVEYEEPLRVRLVAESHGTVWDSTFSVEPLKEGSRLTIAMDARAKKWFPRLMNRLIRGMIANAMEKDLAFIASYCEGESS